eukprot:456763-Rhodomonas_salina.1
MARRGSTSASWRWSMLMLCQLWMLAVVGEQKKCPSEKDRADDLVAAARVLMRTKRDEEARACLELAVKKAPK